MWPASTPARSRLRAAISFCANTPHKIYREVVAAISVPLIHIADVTAKAISEAGIDSVCFIGTKYSMTDSFVTDRIASHGIHVQTPQDEALIEELHRIIQQELTYHEIIPDSKKFVTDQIHRMADQGSSGVVLG